MWIFTTFGFFSAVAHRSDSRMLLVRGRVLEDLETLAKNIEVRNPGDGNNRNGVQRTPDADYPYRVTVERRAFAQLMSEDIAAIDYDNFKNAVASSQSIARSHLYGNVWGQMHDAERKLDKYEVGSV